MTTLKIYKLTYYKVTSNDDDVIKTIDLHPLLTFCNKHVIFSINRQFRM